MPERRTDPNQAIDQKIFADEQHVIGRAALARFHEVELGAEQANTTNLLARHAQALHAKLIDQARQQGKKSFGSRMRNLGAAVMRRPQPTVQMEFVVPRQFDELLENSRKPGQPVDEEYRNMVRRIKDVMMGRPAIAIVSDLIHEISYPHNASMRREGIRLELLGSHADKWRKDRAVTFPAPGNKDAQLQISRFVQDIDSGHYSTEPLMTVGSQGEVTIPGRDSLTITEDDNLHALGLLSEFSQYYGLSPAEHSPEQHNSTVAIPMLVATAASRLAWNDQLYR